MGNQTPNKIKKAMVILLGVLLVTSLTVTAASADDGWGHGYNHGWHHRLAPWLAPRLAPRWHQGWHHDWDDWDD